MWFSEYELAKYKVNKDDLLVSEGGEVGRTCIWKDEIKECYIQNSVNKVKITKGNSYYFLYHFYSLGSIDIFNLLVNKVSIAHLTKEKLKEIELAFPPILEQTAIANFLDRKTAEIDQTIADKKQLINLFEEEKKALINEAVTKGLNPNVKLKPSGIDWLGDIPAHWEVKKLKYLVGGKLLYGANESAEFDDAHNPRYIRITDFGDDGKLRDDTFKSLPHTIAEDYLLHEGDILFARSGATVGKTFQFKAYKGKACFAGYLIKASPDKSKMLSDWLYYFTKSGLYENWKSSIFNQATIQNIGADKYNTLNIPIASLDEQTSIVNHIESETTKINNKINLVRREIELITEYRQALIFEAVTGKIDCQNWDLGI